VARSQLDDLVEKALELRAVAHVRSLLSTWHGRIIALVVVGGLLLPLHYYLPTHRDAHDERFAWRMFSPMRMAKCSTKFTRNDAPLDATAEFHEAWLELAKRGRFRVIEAMGAHLCKKYSSSSIAIELDCTYLDQTVQHIGGFNLCTVPHL
jgi:hypothetical protein